jgi:hypothetical protein
MEAEAGGRWICILQTSAYTYIYQGMYTQTAAYTCMCQCRVSIRRRLRYADTSLYLYSGYAYLLLSCLRIRLRIQGVSMRHSALSLGATRLSKIVEIASLIVRKDSS